MTGLKCDRVSMKYGALSAVQMVSFSLNPGEILGMIGPNGAGKTTLFNCMIGILKPSSGRIFLYDTDITGMKPHKICRMGMVKTSQIMQPFMAMTVFENVLVAALHGAQLKMGKAKKETEKVLDMVQLSEHAYKLSNSIPVPARRRLELARALATGANILLLDENMAGLNPHEIDEALEILKKIRESGKSLIVVEHIMRAVMGISDRVICLNYGAKIAEGFPEEVVNNEAVIRAYLGEKLSGLKVA